MVQKIQDTYRFNEVLNLYCALNLEHDNPFLHKIRQLMMTYYPKISSSADMVETLIFNYMSPPCGLGLEDSKPISLHDTLALNGAPTYKFGNERFST